MDKLARQFAVKEIIGNKHIANQDVLRLELRKRGFHVTQATLSRDLKELGVFRVASGDDVHYALQPASEVRILGPVVGPQILSIRANESVIVIKTLPGSASVVGEFLDSLGSEEIIGTLAGDNTLMVIPESQKKTQKILELLRKKLIEGLH